MSTTLKGLSSVEHRAQALAA
nr:hypothetical protein [Lentzea atacamensis]